MRTNILFILLLLLPAIGQSQQVRGFCGTDRYDLDLITDKLLQNKKTFAEQPQLRSVVKYVPVTFHLVADDNGNGRAFEENILAQLCSLNEQFADQEIIFYLNNWSYKDLTVLYNTPTHPTSQFQMVNILRDLEAANVFVLNSADNNGNTPGTTLGYYSRVNDHIVIRKSETNGFSATLAHEFGHFFSLLHPHNGWGCEPYDEELHGNPVSSAWAPCVSSTNGASIQAELVDGSNCNTSGDYLCDTPPDYNFGFGWSVAGDQCAPYNAGTMDFNGDVIDVMENNVMAYFIDCDEYAFTTSQKSMIQTDYFSPQRSYIRTGYIPNTTPITDDVNYIEPINDITTPVYNSVLLDWQDVPNADHYLVMIDRLQSFTFQPQRILVDQSHTYIENLDPDKKYYWRVWPYNESVTCAGWSAIQSFTTGTGTSVKEIPFVDNLHVYPNPTRGQSSIQVELTTQQDFRGSVALFNLYGQKARDFGDHHFASTASTTMELAVSGLAPGMYLMRINAHEGILTRKILVQ